MSIIRMLYSLVALIALAPATARAEMVFYDAFDQNPCDGVCDVDGHNHCSLRAAIQEANCAGGGGAVLSAGAYTVSLGPIVVNANLSIIGSGMEQTSIVGSGGPGGNGFAVLESADYFARDLTISQFDHAIGGGRTVTLERVRLAANTDSQGNGAGAAVNGAASLILRQAETSGNQGRALVVGTATVIDSTFVANTGGALLSGDTVVERSAFIGNGAAMPTDGGALNAGTLMVTDSTFDGNAANTGGAIRATSLSVTGCTFSHNEAVQRGGAIHVPWTWLGGAVSITESVFDGNWVGGAFGGGAMYLNGVSLTVQDSLFSGNSAPNGSGGALWLGDAFEPLSIANSVMSGNSALWGGAMSLDTRAPGIGENAQLVHLDHVKVLENVATFGGPFDSTTGAGAGLYFGQGALQVDDSEFAGNASGAQGAGVYLAAGSTGGKVFQRTLFAENSTESDGAALYDNDTADVQLVSSTVSGNAGPVGAGAVTASDRIGTQGRPGPLRLDACTIAYNVGLAGVKVARTTPNWFGNLPAIRLRSSIVSNNAASCSGTTLQYYSDYAGAYFTARRILDDGHGLEDQTACDFTDPTSLSGTDPKLAALSDNTGVSRSHALGSDSPALDAGDPLLVEALFDQRRIARPLGASHDIGAYEAEAVAPAVLSMVPSTGSTAGGTLVTVTGRSLVGAVVSLGGVPCEPVVVVNATRLTCTTSAHAAGLVDLTVTNGANLQGTLVLAFNYAPPPPAPASLVATAGDRRVELTWDAVGAASSYRVERSLVDGGPYTLIGLTSDTYHSDGNLQNGVPCFYVVSSVSVIATGPRSAQVTATPRPDAPAAPTGLGLLGGTAEVALTWSPSPTAASYVVKRSLVDGGPFEAVATVATNVFTDTGLAPGTRYFYVIGAQNAGGTSPDSAPASALTRPAAPGGLAATAGDAVVTLSWAPTPSATAYLVKSSEVEGGAYAPVAEVSATGYVDAGRTNGRRIYYVVIAMNASGDGPPSSIVSALPLPPAPATAPTGLAPVGGMREVYVSWNPLAGATGYNIVRSTSAGGPFELVATTPYVAAMDVGLPDGATFHYRVSAFNLGGEGPLSAAVAATTAPGLPAAPTGLQASPGNGTIALLWNAVPAVNGYNIKRALSPGGPYSTIAGTASTSYSDGGRTNGTTYYYVVTATNQVGEGPASLEVQATPVAPPAKVSGLAAVAGDTRVSLTWSATAGATGYRIKRSTVSRGAYVEVGTAGATSFADAGLTNGTTYYYVVSATNAGGEGGNSGQVSATPQGRTLRFTSPTAGGTVAGKRVSVKLTSTGFAGNRIFAFSVDGTPYATQTLATAGATFTWNTLGLANGGHVLSATVTQAQAGGVPPVALASIGVTVAN